MGEGAGEGHGTDTTVTVVGERRGRGALGNEGAEGAEGMEGAGGAEGAEGGVSSLPRTWGGWTWDCVKGWRPILRLALPGAVMICSEWWSWEFWALAAGWLSHVDLGAQGVGANTCALLFMMPSGLSIVNSVMIGNALGRGDAAAAREVCSITLCIFLLIEGAQCSLLLALRFEWPLLFTKDPDVVSTAVHIMPWVVAFTFLDGLQGVLSGVLRWYEVDTSINFQCSENIHTEK